MFYRDIIIITYDHTDFLFFSLILLPPVLLILTESRSNNS